MQNFLVRIAKKINNIFWGNSNEISIGPHLNEKLCWANQIFVDSTKQFSGCTQLKDFKIKKKEKEKEKQHFSDFMCFAHCFDYLKVIFKFLFAFNCPCFLLTRRFSHDNCELSFIEN